MTTGDKAPYPEEVKWVYKYDSPSADWPSTTSSDIMEGDLLHDALDRFMSKQADYQDSADDLGLAGQYSELHRKLGKCRREMWEGIPLEDESLMEVLQDFLGHILLAMRYVENEDLTRYPKGKTDVRR